MTGRPRVLFKFRVMADNYLENRYEEYLARKQKKEQERKAKFRRQLEEYRKKKVQKEE